MSAGSTAQDRQRIESIVVWLDQFQQELERLRRPDDAVEVRQIAHDLAKFCLRVFGPISTEGAQT